VTTGATIRDRVTDARRRLKAAGISDIESALDARLLVQEVLGWDTARLIADGGDVAPLGFDEAFNRFVTRREQREPLAPSWDTGILGTTFKSIRRSSFPARPGS
jgi:methylase of polypeptide subunit release factors